MNTAMQTETLEEDDVITTVMSRKMLSVPRDEEETLISTIRVVSPAADKYDAILILVGSLFMLNVAAIVWAITVSL